jgi:anti-sigma-K factor RskA
MTMDRHVDIADKLEAYVLGQLDEHERREADAHLRVCATCAQEVRELIVVLDGIAESVPPMAPPLALRQRVLADVAALPQDPQVSGFSLITPQSDRPAAHELSRRSRWSLLPLAAAAVLVLAIGVVAFRIEQARQDLADDVSRTRVLNVDLQKRLQRYAGQTDLALSILTAGDMREIPLVGRESAAAAAARAYVSPTRGLLVVADRLPAPPPGRIYQVWVIEGNNEPVSAGLLGDEPGGRGMLIVTPPRPGTGGSVTIAVTDEPPGGLQAPSGSMRLAGSI